MIKDEKKHEIPMRHSSCRLSIMFITDRQRREKERKKERREVFVVVPEVVE